MPDHIGNALVIHGANKLHIVGQHIDARSEKKATMLLADAQIVCKCMVVQ